MTAARRLMSQRPRDAFTVDDVVRGAGVAKGSFYNHFSDRDHLVEEINRSVRDKEEAEVDACNEGVTDPLARICRGMAVYARFAMTMPDEAHLLALSQTRGPSFEARHEGLFSDLRLALHQGSIVAPSIDAAAMLVIGQVVMLMARLSGQVADQTTVLVVQHSLAMTLAALGISLRDAQQMAAQAADAVVLSADSTGAACG